MIELNCNYTVGDYTFIVENNNAFGKDFGLIIHMKTPVYQKVSFGIPKGIVDDLNELENGLDYLKKVRQCNQNSAIEECRQVIRKIRQGEHELRKQRS